MTYNELRAALKTYRSNGLTDISLNSKKTELQAEYDRLTAIPTTEPDLESVTLETVENDTPVLSTIPEFQTVMNEYFEAPAEVDKELYLPIVSEIGEIFAGLVLGLAIYGMVCQWCYRTTLKGIALGRTWYPLVHAACKLVGIRILLWYITMAEDAYESGKAYKRVVMYYKRLAING
jgi:hypothetical protein